MTRRIFEGDSVEEDEAPSVGEKPASQKTAGKKSQLSGIAAKAPSHSRKTTKPSVAFSPRVEKDTMPPLNVLNPENSSSLRRTSLGPKNKTKQTKLNRESE